MPLNDINDPRTIPQTDMPIHLVLSNQTTSIISFGIDWNTKANYDHTMQSINSGKFICQDFGGYHEIKMDSYLKSGGCLKFVKLINANEVFNIAFRSSILNRLDRPWYMKIYDFGNVFGRAIGLPWLHIPGTFDCSEVCLYHLKQCAMYLPKLDSDIIMKISDRSSPADLDTIVKLNPKIFSIYGIWMGDDGVVV